MRRQGEDARGGPLVLARLPGNLSKGWQLEAACRARTRRGSSPELLRKREEKDAREAKASASVPGAGDRECLEYALRIREPHGIWGGRNELERLAAARGASSRLSGARPRRRPAEHGRMPSTPTEVKNVIEDRLAELGIELPPAPPVASYVPVRFGAGPRVRLRAAPFDGATLLHPGHVGAEVSLEQAGGCPRCALQALSAIRDALGSLEAVTGIVKVDVFVASAPGSRTSRR